MDSFINYYHTIVHLRTEQIFYQLWYRIRKSARKALGIKYALITQSEGSLLKLDQFLEKPESLMHDTFVFLNQKSEESGFIISGKMTRLWKYHLNYMDYLLQPGMEKKKGIQLINEYIDSLPQNLTGLEPYPIALRGINWIKFISRLQVSVDPDPEEIKTLRSIDSSLYAQYLILADNIEFNLMGNHLLEDGFSLLFGAFYFRNEKFYKLAGSIIRSELNEQILSDGAHFELSPMYHQIMLDRNLDCINLINNNSRFNGQGELLELLRTKAAIMMGWLMQVTFLSGEIPYVNDAAPGMSPSTGDLLNYSARLGIKPVEISLSESGYRMFRKGNFELFVDYGIPGPDYIPGHAHSDIFNFILYINGKLIICDTGTSSYEKGTIRSYERSTRAHNTVSINDMEQSVTWNAFRMGKRCKPVITTESDNSISGFHKGFDPLSHTREFKVGDDSILITDTISEELDSSSAFFHLAPGILPVLSGNSLNLGSCKMNFQGAEEISIQSCQISSGFNIRHEAKMVLVKFRTGLLTEIFV